jgi:hypothetical protein
MTNLPNVAALCTKCCYNFVEKLGHVWHFWHLVTFKTFIVAYCETFINCTRGLFPYTPRAFSWKILIFFYYIDICLLNSSKDIEDDFQSCLSFLNSYYLVFAWPVLAAQKELLYRILRRQTQFLAIPLLGTQISLTYPLHLASCKHWKIWSWSSIKFRMILI